ncbi:MAG: GNAT family N-acetyltransferase [Pleurocapsa sp. MO_192.B19]|nr:GNAT family N-acetyltransferase [Pleurocapsa sp. MO_192.B19]
MIDIKNQQHLIRRVEFKDAEALADLKIRLSQETDFIPFLDIERDTLISHTKDELSQLLSNNRAIWVIEDTGSLVGYLDIDRYLMPKVNHAAFLEIGIRESHRGLGLGTNLILESELWAKSVGIKRIWFYVVADNLGAIILYLKLGYRFEGLRRNGYFVDGKFTDEYIMAKMI